MKDSTGRELKKGMLVHIPKDALPGPVLIAEIVEVIEAGAITVPGQPPRPPHIILTADLVLGGTPQRPDVVPFCYVVGEKVRRTVPPEEPQKKIEGLDAEDPLKTDTSSPPLESEKPPEGIVLE